MQTQLNSKEEQAKKESDQFNRWMSTLLMTIATEVLSEEALKAVYESNKISHGTNPIIDGFQSTMLVILKAKQKMWEEYEKENNGE